VCLNIFSVCLALRMVMKRALVLTGPAMKLLDSIYACDACSRWVWAGKTYA
jgi:hypothetical protein